MALDDDDAPPKLKRLANGRIAPGYSLNPSGRPARLKEITELAQNMSADALNRLYQIFMDPKTPPMAAVTAAIHVLDRAGGKPAQPQLSINVDGSASGDGDTGALTALLARAKLYQQNKVKVIR